MTDTRQALLPCPFCGHKTPTFERIGTPRQSCIVACGNCGCRHESGDEGSRSGSSWNERAALSAQPVAGAVAGKYGDVLTPFVACMEAELHANSRKGDRPGWLSMSREVALLEIYWHTAKLSAAVKNNDAALIREHSADVANMAMMLLDICGGLLAAPQAQAAPAPEPSAQAVREPGDPLHDDAYVRGVAVGFVEDDSRRTTLLRIADRMQKLAASPQPEPSAQGEPVALTEHQKTAPRRIWLNIFYDEDRPFPSDHEGITWCDDEVGDFDVPYVRADIASAPSTPPPAVEAVPLPDCTVADVGFRWAGTEQQHVPSVLVEFEPVRAGSGLDSKGWKDRDAFVSILKAAATIKTPIRNFRIPDLITPKASHGVVEAVPLDEHVHAVVRSVQPYLDVRCRAWKELTEQCRYWLKAERAHGIAPKAAQPVEGER